MAHYGPAFRLYLVKDPRGTRRQLASKSHAEKLAREIARKAHARIKDVLVPSRNCYVREYVAGGKRGSRVNTGKTTLEAANQWARRREGRAPVVRKKGHQLFGAAVDEWLADLRLARRAAKTLVDYNCQAGFWKQAFGKKAVSEIGTDDVREFFRRRESGELGAKRPGARLLNLNRTILRAFFRWAADEDRQYCQGDPTRFLKQPWQEEEKEPRVLDADEVAALLRACREPYTVKTVRRRIRPYVAEQEHLPPPHLYPLVAAGLLTMLRYSNLAQLTWGQVDLDELKITIPPGQTKRRREIEVPISTKLETILRELGPGCSEGAVFGQALGSIRKSFQAAVRRARIKGRVTFHTLRKTASNHLQRGQLVPDETTQKFGSWQDLSVMKRHYRAVDDDELREAAKHLDDLVA